MADDGFSDGRAVNSERRLPGCSKPSAYKAGYHHHACRDGDGLEMAWMPRRDTPPAPRPAGRLYCRLVARPDPTWRACRYAEEPAGSTQPAGLSHRPEGVLWQLKLKHRYTAPIRRQRGHAVRYVIFLSTIARQPNAVTCALPGKESVKDLTGASAIHIEILQDAQRPGGCFVCFFVCFLTISDV